MDKSAKQLGRRMLAIYRATEEQTAKAAESVNASCKPGCAACCNHQVLVSLPEAVAMAEPLMENPQVLAQTIQRCHEQLKVQKLDRDAHFRQNIPCVFLTADKHCGIYERRPIACRNHVVVSPPENCAPSDEPKEVTRLNLSKVDNYMLEQSAWVSKQRQIPILIAPIPVALLWAIRLLTEGENAFINALENEQDLGILDIRGWTQHALRVAEKDESKSLWVPPDMKGTES